MKNKYTNKYKYKPDFRVVARSNIVQYDDFGNPLRLCIVEYLHRRNGRKKSDIEEMWLDSKDQEGDIECKWTKVTQ